MQQPSFAPPSAHYDFLDILKAAAIFSVILYHSFTASSNFLGDAGWVALFHYFCKSILSTCVPLFFLVNGALILNRPFQLNRHLRKTGMIFLLATVWAVIDVVAMMFLKVEHLSLKEAVQAVCNLKSGWCNHLWFMYTLVMVYFFVPVLKQVFDANRTVYHYFLAVAAFFAIGRETASMGVTVADILFSDHIFGDLYRFVDRINPFWGINGIALTYFMLGGSLFQLREKLNTRPMKIGAAAAIPVLLSGWFFYAFRVSRYYGKLVDIVYNGYGTPFIFLCTIALFILSLPYHHRGRIGGLIRAISANTLGIYLLQTTMIPLFSRWITGWTIAKSILFSCAFAGVILLACLVLCLGLKRVPGVKYLFRL